MSWLNFNDSLNNLKGQLSNLASGVLTDTSTEDTDSTNKENNYEELQQLIASQAQEILALRKANAEITERVPQNGHSQSNDKWSWDPPDTSHQPDPRNEDPNIIEHLKKRISDLENDKRELTASLDQLDLDCQQTTEKVINIKDALQRDYDDLRVEHESILDERDNLRKENIENGKCLQQLQTEKAKLLKELNKYKRTDNNDAFKNRVAELEEINLKLQRELENRNNTKEPEHSATTETSAENTDAAKKALSKEINELNMKLREYESCHINDREEYDKLAKILEGYEQQLKSYEEQNELLQSENQKLLERENAIVLELSALKEILDKSKSNELNCTRELHQKHLNFLIDSFKKFMDYPLPIENNKQNENSFMDAVEATMKILLDLKWKTETLKKEVDDMTEEKTRILTAKNHEINKLLENSEVLSQEVITKTQALKNFEEENSELIKNNDDLISQLEMYKFNTRGLHTISESNEDNLLILESQLEKSNKKIKELEMTISDLENSKQEATLEVQSELDYIKKQLNLTGTELSHTKSEYQKLLEEHKELQLEHVGLQNVYAETKTSYSKCFNENESLNTTVDKIQSEIENTEYRYSEININMETLKEETETLRGEIDTLRKANKKLEMLNVDYESKNELIQNEVDDLKQQLITEIDSREQQDIQIRSLSEKLQNAKMSETYFKLQNDTLHKELKSVTESNQDLALKYKNLLENYEESKNCLRKYETENLELVAKCKEFEDTKRINQELQSRLAEISELKSKNEKILLKLKAAEDEVSRLKEDNENIKNNVVSLDLQEYESKISVLEKKYAEVKEQLASSNQRISDLSNENQDLLKRFDEVNKSFVESSDSLQESAIKIEKSERYIQELTNTRNEMLNFVNAKHQENIQYHNEIQRLNQVLVLQTEKTNKFEKELKEMTDHQMNESKHDEKIAALEKENAKMTDEIEKLTDQNDFLRKKSEVLAQNLLEEQAKVQQVIAEKNNATSEKEASLTKELQRLREHLMEMEETHTQEMVQAEKRIQEMVTKVNEIEHREKESSTHYTSVNIRTNQHVETLQNQLQMVTNQRDDLRKKISDAEDQISKQTAALSNLQFVLEQFRKDKEKDIYLETERIRRQVNVEKQKQDDLQKEIVSLRNQLGESKQGLLAASRLSNQVESSKQQVIAMKDEVAKLEEKLKKSEEKYNSLINQTDAKVDKMLIKNLIVGFISSNNNLNKDQYQILKIIATVLDFNHEDNEKVHINKATQGSWMTSILHPQVINRGQEITQESLSQAFVRFLENESKPRQLPNLLETTPLDSPSSASSNEKPILMSEVVLPTFADFGQNRISSSILKDVLKDKS